MPVLKAEIEEVHHHHWKSVEVKIPMSPYTFIVFSFQNAGHEQMRTLREMVRRWEAGGPWDASKAE